MGNQDALEIKKNLNSKSRDLWEDDMEFGSRNEESYQRRSKELEGYFENEPKKNDKHIVNFSDEEMDPF